MKPGIEGAAEALWQARSERKTIARVSETFDIQTVQDAYAIAEVNVSRALAAGARCNAQLHWQSGSTAIPCRSK